MRTRAFVPTIEGLPARINPVVITQVGPTVQVLTQPSDIDPIVSILDDHLPDGTAAATITAGDAGHVPIVLTYPVTGPNMVNNFYCDDSQCTTTLEWVNLSHVNSQVIAGPAGATMVGGPADDWFVGGLGLNVFVGGTGFTRMFGADGATNVFDETDGGNGSIFYWSDQGDVINTVPDPGPVGYVTFDVSSLYPPS